MIELRDHPEGVVLPVRAQAGGSKNSLRGEHGGAVKVSVTQVAEKGKANASIVETLADALDLKRSQIELISGATQAQKQFLVRGITRDELYERLKDAGV